MHSLDKKDWVCTQPFEFAEIFDHKMYMCCPNWLPEDLGNPNNILENFKSEKAQAIRDSMLDGSYKYCIESRCPKLTGLKEGKTTGFIPKSEYIKRIKEFENQYPHQLKFNFDQSCNLKCPSCRLDFINYEGRERERTEELIHNIETQVGSILTHIECTGSGDPFFSRTFRKWMMNFDPLKYPNLNSIHLHTNATLWNKSNWDRMKNIHPFVKSCEISVDAASKDTYEQKVRLGGDWNKLNDNLKYIASLPTLGTVTLSFVVQSDNVGEMADFYYFTESVFGNTTKNWSVFYNRIVNWGHLTEDQFQEMDIANPNHENYNLVVEQYNKLPITERVKHNLEI